MNRASSLILIFPIWHHSVVRANACTTTLMSGYKKKNATVATLAMLSFRYVIWNTSKVHSAVNQLVSTLVEFRKAKFRVKKCNLIFCFYRQAAMSDQH